MLETKREKLRGQLQKQTTHFLQKIMRELLFLICKNAFKLFIYLNIKFAMTNKKTE